MKRWPSIFLSLLFLAGCAGQRMTGAPTAFDFTKVRRISVDSFDGPGAQAVTDEFVRQLLGTGIEVTDGHHPGDAILKGSVVDYKANNQLTVFLGEGNPIVSPNAQTPTEAAAISAHKSPIASVMASVGIQTQLTDPSNHRILWADSYSYEGLDLAAALGPVVATLTRSMGKVMPQMNHPKS
jgi:hypothetical protein